MTTPDVTIGQTVYVTKDALQFGIEEWSLLNIDQQGYATVGRAVKRGTPPRLFTKHWHLTIDEALAHAKIMRDAEVSRLETEVARLRALTF